jgi:hypothetical protein
MAKALNAMLFTIVTAATVDAVASPVTPGQISVSTTTQSIGLVWAVTGDTDHDASAAVEYRQTGVASWSTAMNLVRVDSSETNSLAGSILFLTPGTSYEVRVTLTDPDGATTSRTINATTAPAPQRPTPLRTLHVVPGNGGGTGSAADPYRGLAAAWAHAQPGDELLLHGGSYGGIDDNDGRSGTASQPIVVRAAGDGEVVLSYLQLFLRSHLWFEGLTFRHDGSSDTGFYSSLLNPGYDMGFQPMQATITNIVLMSNRFEGFKHSIRLGPRTNRWFIADNTLIGDKQLGATGTARLDGEGIELGHGSNHEVAFNSITLHADGISFPEENCDIYGNDIFNVTDDGIELDGGQANTRVWQNRIHNASNNGIAFQPQAGAPWYIVRNQIVNAQESIFKLRDADRFVAAHNTFVNWGWVIDHWSHLLFNGITRNNLWISVNNGPIWNRADGGMSWRTDFDYDGFDWGSNGQPFDVNGRKYSSLDALRNATGQEAHGIRINARTCLETFDVPGPPPLTSVPPQLMTLRSTCNAVDAGVVLPNLSDGYTGAAPDLGAYERGALPPHYGPRSAVRPMAPTGLSAR